jgi:hypothetical protein
VKNHKIRRHNGSVSQFQLPHSKRRRACGTRDGGPGPITNRSCFNHPPPLGVHEAGTTDASDYDGTDSGVEGSDGFDTSSYATSLLSEVRAYSYENGRRYHSYRQGEYIMPNDENEQDRQDLLHHVRNLTLGGALFLAPIGKAPQRVLDIGTGTGIWAIDFADQFPSAEVIGTE